MEKISTSKFEQQLLSVRGIDLSIIDLLLSALCTLHFAALRGIFVRFPSHLVPFLGPFLSARLLRHILVYSGVLLVQDLKNFKQRGTLVLLVVLILCKIKKIVQIFFCSTLS